MKKKIVKSCLIALVYTAAIYFLYSAFTAFINLQRHYGALQENIKSLTEQVKEQDKYLKKLNEASIKVEENAKSGEKEVKQFKEALPTKGEEHSDILDIVIPSSMLRGLCSFGNDANCLR